MTNKNSAAAEEALSAASKTLKGKILLSTSSASEGLGKRLADYIGVKESDTPCVKIVVPTDAEVLKYTLSGEITADSLVNFYEDFKAGKVKPTFKSAPVPANPLDGNVRVLVGLNFEEVVYDDTKDVLVEFYAPWCGHCKSLAPVYDKVAERLKVNSNIVIAKCDATDNEIEGVGIQGFPTIKLFTSNGGKKAIDYDGGRDEEGFLKWLKEKATVAWVDLEASGEGEPKKDEL